MFLSEFIIFSVNTTLHRSCPEQSVKQLQVFPALCMDMDLTALLICSLLWSIMQLWIKFHQKHLCWINMIYFCLFICCLIYFIFKGSSEGSSQHISLYFIIKHIFFVPVNVQEHVQWRFKPWFLSPNPSLRSIYIRSLLHHPKHSQIWPPPWEELKPQTSSGHCSGARR